MTISELGSLGELVAAIATVVTLAYLALQIRNNTVLTRSEANRASRNETTATARLIAGNDDVARILHRGLSDPGSLDPVEKVRFRFLLGSLISTLTQAYKEWQLGVSDERDLLERIDQFRAIFSTPGGQWYWQAHREGYAARERDYFDAQFSSKAQAQARGSRGVAT